MKFVPNAVSMRLARSALLSRQASPTFLFASGVVGVTCSTILACRATLKLSDVLDQAHNDITIADNLLAVDEYSKHDHKKDITRIYVKSVVEIGTLYAPAVVVGAASIAALTKSHTLLNQRNAGLMAAYAALDKGFSEYRGRVIEKYGEDQDRQFRYETEEIEVVDENGKKKTITQVAQQGSIYARFFDPTSLSWNKEHEYNYEFLRCQQNHANDMLRARGHVFLNEIYDMLGLERSAAGQVVGWVWNNPEGDNYIDFGCFDVDGGYNEFMTRIDNSVLLDFNVDGVVYDKLPQINGINEVNS